MENSFCFFFFCFKFFRGKHTKRNGHNIPWRDWLSFATCSVCFHRVSTVLLPWFTSWEWPPASLSYHLQSYSIGNKILYALLFLLLHYLPLRLCLQLGEIKSIFLAYNTCDLCWLRMKEFFFSKSRFKYFLITLKNTSF